jgi:hypothetical protein
MNLRIALGIIGVLVLLYLTIQLPGIVRDIFPKIEEAAYGVAGPASPKGEGAGLSASIGDWTAIRKQTEFVDRDSLSSRGAAAYTYVLAPDSQTKGRLLKLIDAVFRAAAAAGTDSTSSQFVNLFYVPTRQHTAASAFFWQNANAGGGLDALVERIANEHYDRELSFDIARVFCERCARGLGPYLIAVTRSIRLSDADTPPHLLIDLSTLHENIFPALLERLAQPLSRESPDETATLAELMQRLKATQVQLSDWIGAPPEGPAGFAVLVGVRGQQPHSQTR